jgi:hypothetical protein
MMTLLSLTFAAGVFIGVGGALVLSCCLAASRAERRARQFRTRLNTICARDARAFGFHRAISHRGGAQ